MQKFLEDLHLAEIPVPGRRDRTMVLDRLAYGAEETADMLGDFIGTVKIGWGLPLLLDEKVLLRRVGHFRARGIHVSNGGTLLETAISRGKAMQCLARLREARFDTIELSEGIIDIPERLKRSVAEFAHSNGLRLNVEVGKKNPGAQLSLDETVERISSSADLGPDMIIIEGRETGTGVEIYDGAGNIKWDWVERILEECDSGIIMFEAPMERQQTEMIMRLGPDVALGNVSVTSVGALETQRNGLRGDTFGYSQVMPDLRSGPASKFIYYVLSTRGAMDQTRIVRTTGVNRRTVQKSLENLIRAGVVTETRDQHDLRRRIYACSHGLREQ